MTITIALTYPLPFGHPTVLGAHYSDDPVEVVTRAVINLVLIVLHLQKLLAIVASVVLKLLKRLWKKVEQFIYLAIFTTI